MDLYLDSVARVGKSDALYEQLRNAIVNGRLRVGDRLPTSRGLASELGVSRNTVTAVYGRLVAEGFVSGRSGAGSFVSYAAAPPPSGERPSALTAVNVGLGDASDWSLGGFDGVEPEIDLRTGRPDPALFPLPEWRRAVRHAFDVPPPSYGHPAGLPSLRRALAQWIGRSRGVVAEPDQIIVTAGAQQGIDLVARLMLRPGDVAAVEEPGYPPVANLLAALGVAIASVRVDDGGLMVEEIPSAARLVYVTPSHQSPTGVAMSLARRRALLEFAGMRNIVVIEDDYDTEYRHGDRPLEPIYRLDASGRVIYVGTFSKTLSPSLRVGFVVLPPSLVNDAIILRSSMDWQPPAAIQQALYTFIVDGHLERHLRRTRPIYSDRYRTVRAWLQQQQRHGVVDKIIPTDAGLHITAQLAPGRSEAEFRRAAAALGIALGNFGGCWRTPSNAEGITIGFGATDVTVLRDALAALSNALTVPSRS